MAVVGIGACPAGWRQYAPTILPLYNGKYRQRGDRRLRRKGKGLEDVNEILQIEKRER